LRYIIRKLSKQSASYITRKKLPHMPRHQECDHVSHAYTQYQGKPELTTVKTTDRTHRRSRRGEGAMFSQKCLQYL